MQHLLSYFYIWQLDIGYPPRIWSISSVKYPSNELYLFRWTIENQIFVTKRNTFQHANVSFDVFIIKVQMVTKCFPKRVRDTYLIPI